MTTFATNKKATFNYKFLEKYEAGLSLYGHEVKSIKSGNISLKGAFVSLSNEEFYLTNAFIPLYKFSANVTDYEPTRSRKLLLKKSEINSLIGKKRTEGLTFVPIRVYNKGKYLKLEFALARGKKKHDKRADIAKRDNARRINRALRT